MSNTVTISCILNTTNSAASLGFEGWIDDQRFINIDHVREEQKILIEIPDADGNHKLKFVMKNKKDTDTKIDDDGNIVSDAILSIKDLAFDEIQIGHTLTELASYVHDFNGTKELTENKFYGEMGCNGTVSLDFSTPIYLWLLENM